jgi:hypothetical protein
LVGLGLPHPTPPHPKLGSMPYDPVLSQPRENVVLVDTESGCGFLNPRLWVWIFKP